MSDVTSAHFLVFLQFGSGESKGAGTMEDLTIGGVEDQIFRGQGRGWGLELR